MVNPSFRVMNNYYLRLNIIEYFGPKCTQCKVKNKMIKSRRLCIYLIVLETI